MCISILPVLLLKISHGSHVMWVMRSKKMHFQISQLQGHISREKTASTAVSWEANFLMRSDFNIPFKTEHIKNTDFQCLRCVLWKSGRRYDVPLRPIKMQLTQTLIQRNTFESQRSTRTCFRGVCFTRIRFSKLSNVCFKIQRVQKRGTERSHYNITAQKTKCIERKALRLSTVDKGMV